MSLDRRLLQMGYVGTAEGRRTRVARLLFLASRDIAHPHVAGGDIVMYQIAAGLAREGHEVRYICSGHPTLIPEDRLDGVHIIRLGSVFTTSPRFLLRRSKDAVRWSDAIVEEVVGGLRVPYLSTWFADQPHLCLWYQRNRLIFTAQYGPSIGFILSHLESVVARMYRNAIILTLSDASGRDLVELGLRSNQIRVCRPGINGDLLRFAATPSDGREPLLLVIGKFRRYKRLDIAILVLQRLHELGTKNARLVIAGRREDESYRQELLDLGTKLGVAQSLSIECDITEERKAELFRRAKILLITSPLEGFGMTAIEANLFGVPVLATTGVPGDTVLEGFTGYRVPFGNTDAMAAHAARLLSDEGEWLSLSRNAATFATSYTWEAMLETVRTALRDLGI